MAAVRTSNHEGTPLALVDHAGQMIDRRSILAGQDGVADVGRSAGSFAIVVFRPGRQADDLQRLRTVETPAMRSRRSRSGRGKPRQVPDRTSRHRGERQRGGDVGAVRSRDRPAPLFSRSRLLVKIRCRPDAQQLTRPTRAPASADPLRFRDELRPDPSRVRSSMRSRNRHRLGAPATGRARAVGVAEMTVRSATARRGHDHGDCGQRTLDRKRRNCSHNLVRSGGIRLGTRKTGPSRASLLRATGRGGVRSGRKRKALPAPCIIPSYSASRQLPALVSTRLPPLSYYPLSLWPWQTAVKSMFLERVDVVAHYDARCQPERALSFHR